MPNVELDLSKLTGTPGAYISRDLESGLIYINLNPQAPQGPRPTSGRRQVVVDYGESGQVIGLSIEPRKEQS